MHFFRFFVVLMAFAIGQARADDGISVSATDGSKGLTLIQGKKEPKVVPSLLDGRKEWSFPATDAAGREVYFEVQNDDYKDGGHPSVVFTIDYYDQGTGVLNLDYDSLVEDPAQGSAKRAGTITLSDSKTWKTATFAVTDARFDDRCWENDFRITFANGVTLNLGAVGITIGTAPASVVWRQTPRGKIIEGVFDQSKIFPGTTRKFSVYIPKQYDPATPACLYVGQDGLRKEFTHALNQLIDQKKIPVMVGLFISPGSLEPPSKDQDRRNNRSFEYDSLGDAYARFLLDEMIPYVAKTYNLNLSDKGDDRCIGGGSSGGICAFNVAWERPDAFRRVYSISGSYVAFHGGDILPELVRECEPKPLRIFLHVGSNDMVGSGGDWFLDNQEMDRSLKYAGYDYQFRFNDGHHMAMYTEIFPEAMTWLWRDWPAPIKPAVGTSRIQDILVPNESWTEVGEGYQAASGIAVNPQGEVFFCDAPANKIYQVGSDGKPAPFSTDTQSVNALTSAMDGTLHGVSEKSGNVLSFDAQGKATVLAGGTPGHDLTATRNGGFYVTRSGSAGEAESKVWYIDAKGEKKQVDTGLEGATGIAISADGYQLYVADGRSHWVYVYVINPDGTLSDKQRFYWLHTPDTDDDSGAEGLVVDQNGLLYTATRVGIEISGLQGHTQGYMPSPGQRITSLCLGGPGFNELYVTCGDKVYKRVVKSKGEYIFNPPIIRPKGGGL